jgi:hypothetical protein
MDYRALNEVTIRNKYTLPRINSVVCVCSLRLIFDQDIISRRFQSVTYRRLHSF